MKSVTILLLIKYAIYGGIAARDYAIGSKWVVAWLLLAHLMLAFAIINELQTKTKNSQS